LICKSGIYFFSHVKKTTLEHNVGKEREKLKRKRTYLVNQWRVFGINPSGNAAEYVYSLKLKLKYQLDFTGGIFIALL